ncbi:MAG: arginine repressor [Clostridiales bacterium]|jgi:transcriptional regulator of arginine metabolism|nr:arginine repressor [Clostridiales bacterium]
MRYSRQNKILELISTYDIETQDMLLKLLKESDFEVTQATISRDIKELQLIKTLSPSGKYKYAVGNYSDKPVTERFLKIFRETITSYESAENLIVVKTLSGCGNAAAEAIDTMVITHVVGTIAGDNTFLIIVDSKSNVPPILEIFNDIITMRLKNNDR